MENIVVHERIRYTVETLANLSEHHFKVGAVIVKGRRVIAVGHNKTKTHTIIKNKLDKHSLVDKLHAEMDVILKARTDITGSKIYVLRVCPDNRHGSGMSRPCSLCMRLIRGAGIKEIIYTTGNPTQPWAKERILNA